MQPKFAPRKLLVAAVGVATLNYLAVACTPSPPTSGNLPAPTTEPDTGAPPPPTNVPPTSGNLPAPQPVDAAPAPVAVDASTTTSTAPSGSASPLPTASNKNVKPQFKPPHPPTAGNLMMPSGNQNK